MQRQGDIMTAHAITGRRFHRDDRIHSMTAHEGRQGPYGRRRRGRHFGPGQGFGRRAGRGDIRAAILALLTEEPMHGYQIIQELARETASESGKRVYELTDAGREQAAGAPAPWTAVAGENESELMTLHDLAHQVLAAARQVAHAGTAAQIEAAQAVLRDARKALYRLLAEDEDAS